MENMFKDITNDTAKIYKITKPNDYIFYFENKTGTIVFDILCEKATIKIYGLYTGKLTDNFKLNITQSHTAPKSTSFILIKSLLYDSSSLAIKSTIHIKKTGKKVNATFANHNLLLSERSSAITSPSLEVIPSDVVCTHAATTTPLNIKQLEYLAMRGISNQKAKDLLIAGFKNDIQKIKQNHY